MNVGILPCNSSKVWSLIAVLVLRIPAQGNNDKAQVYGGGIQRIERIVELQATIVIIAVDRCEV